MEDEFDFEQLDEIAGDDPEVRQEIVQAFFECGDECLLELEKSINAEDSQWKEHSHALKGVALNFGATKVSELSQSAEEACGKSATEKQELFSEIQMAYKRAKGYLL